MPGIRLTLDIFASDSLVFSDARPRRGRIAFFQRWYGLIVAGGITLVLLVTVTPYEPILGLVTVLGYWVVFLLRHWRRARDAAQGRPERKVYELVRALMLIAAVTALQIYLYVFTTFLQRGGLNHTLWLLLFLGTLFVSQRSSTEHMLIALAAAIASLVLTTVIAADVAPAITQTEPIALGLMEKIVWLSLLSFTLHLFVRFVGNLYADVELLHNVTGEMREHEQSAIANLGPQNMALALKSTVSRIREDYAFPHVNVFQQQPDGKLTCVAAASPAGQQLVDAGFSLTNERSLVVAAAKTGQTQLRNDTEHADDYLPHVVFEKTKAELVVPIQRDQRLLGVLDVQAHRSQAFMPHDQAVMEVLAVQLARTMDNVGAHRWRRRFSELIQSMAVRLLAQNDLEGTLQQIAEGVRDLLQADIVALYERNPQTGAVSSPTCAGKLNLPDLVHAPRMVPGGLFVRLLADPALCYYREDLCSPAPDLPFWPDSQRRSSRSHGFEVREEVRARAVYKLAAGYDCVGIMFVNFRQPQEFNDAFKKGANVFADLAALAIRQAQLDERELELQRQEIGALVHDQLKGNTSHAGSAIRDVLQRGALDAIDAERLTAGLEMLDEMAQAITYLNQSLEDAIVRPLSAEVEVVANRLRKIYQMTVAVDWTAAADSLPPPYPTEIELMLSELILNALRHGKTTHLALSCDLEDDGVCIQVVDNGRGFNPEWVQPRGLKHARDRAERLRGTCNIQAAPGKGAHITIRLPLPVGERVAA